MAGDAPSVPPNLYKVLFENDKVRVLETRYGPGVKSDMHSHPDLVAVPLTSTKAKFTLSEGQTVDLDLQSGEPAFVGAHDHIVDNTGDAEFVVVLSN